MSGVVLYCRAWVHHFREGNVEPLDCRHLISKEAGSKGGVLP